VLRGDTARPPDTKVLADDPVRQFPVVVDGVAVPPPPLA
jgi:hypothetical protein